MSDQHTQSAVKYWVLLAQWWPYWSVWYIHSAASVYKTVGGGAHGLRHIGTDVSIIIASYVVLCCCCWQIKQTLDADGRTTVTQRAVNYSTWHNNYEQRRMNDLIVLIVHSAIWMLRQCVKCFNVE